MLPSLNRLKKEADFSRIFQSGKRSTKPGLLFTHSQNSLDLNRFGIIVSKKVDKRATVRNRLRRVLSVVIAEQLPHIKGSWDIVITVRGAQEQQLKESLREWLAAL